MSDSFFNFLFGSKIDTDNTRSLEGYNKRRVVSRSHKGMYLSEEGNLKEEESLHLGVFGKSGCGKTSAYLICKLFNIEKADRSLIICDAGGTIHDVCSGYFDSIGFDQRVLDFESLESNTFKFNPVHRVSNKNPMSLLQFANIVIDQLGKGGGNEFWHSLSKAIMMLLLEALVSDQTEYSRTIQTLNLWLNMLCTEEQHVLDAFILKHLKSEDSRKEYIAFFESQTEKVLMTVLSVCKSALAKAKPLYNLLSDESILFEETREKPIIIYLKINESNIKDYAFIITLFYAQLFHFLMKLPEDGKPYLPVEILGDEMSAFGVPNLDLILSTIRKRFVKCTLIYQSISQIQSQYSKEESDTILGNLNTLYIFPGIGDSTSERISKMLGTYYNNGREEKVMSSRQIRMIERGSALVVHSNYPAIILNKVKPYFKVKKHLQKSKIKKGGVSS